MRYHLDASVQRFGDVVIGGSPLRLFRLTPAGSRVIDRLDAGDDVPGSALVDSFVDAGAIHPTPEAGRWSASDVTVVVPVHGTYGEPPSGAIVVDDASPEPVAGATIRLDVNSGPGAARNAGLDRVETPFVAFVDADVELPPGWLDPLLAHFADARVGLVAPRVASAGTTTRLERYESAHSPLDLGTEPARVRAGSRVSYVPAAAIVCRTEAVRAIGGFDTTLRFGEDVDLVWRLDRAGWRCRYEPASVVSHAPRASWLGWILQRIGYGSSAAPLSKRHLGALAPARTNVWSVATWLTGLGHPIIGAAIGSGSAAALIPKLPDVPARASFRLGSLGNLMAGEQLAQAIRRAWWPIVVVLAWRSRTARRALLAAVVAARHPLVVADDVAYSIGLWRGMLAERTIDPIRPDLVRWPPKSSRD